MMVVVTVMAVALHLIETLREDMGGCQMPVAVTGGEVENGRVQARMQWAFWMGLVVCLSLCAAAQDQGYGKPPHISARAPEARIDVNTATLNELLKVPGLTRPWAERIVRFRPYLTKADLKEKGVVSGEVYERIKDYVIAHRTKQ